MNEDRQLPKNAQIEGYGLYVSFPRIALLFRPSRTYSLP